MCSRGSSNALGPTLDFDKDDNHINVIISHNRFSVARCTASISPGTRWSRFHGGNPLLEGLSVHVEVPFNRLFRLTESSSYSRVDFMLKKGTLFSLMTYLAQVLYVNCYNLPPHPLPPTDRKLPLEGLSGLN